MVDKTYEQGLIEGEIKTLTELGVVTTKRVNDHSKRLRVLEKAMWITAGIVLFINVWPSIQGFMTSGVGQ